MNKHIYAFILCIVLLLSFSIIAYAGTDISKIQPDNKTQIIIGENISVLNTNPTIIQQKNTTIIIPIEKKTIVNPQNNNTSEPISYNPIEEQNELQQEITNSLAEEIFILTNQARMDAELDNLNYNFDLQDAADLRAQEAAKKFEHIRPDGTSCYTAFQMNYTVAGENLIKVDKEIATAQMLMDTWMNSLGHKENILLKEFTSIAIGVYEQDNIVYVSQLFVG